MFEGGRRLVKLLLIADLIKFYFHSAGSLIDQSLLSYLRRHLVFLWIWRRKKRFSFHIQLTATSACRLPWIVNGTQFNLIHFLILNFFPSFPPCLLATFLRYTNECWRLQLIQKAALIFQQPLTQQLVNVESWWLAFDKYEGETLIGGNSRSSFPHLSSP